MKYKDKDDELQSAYLIHFNSGLSTIKLEGPAVTEKCTIKIIHKPYTHLDNSRTQKAFRIYNEFVNLVFKNKFMFIANFDNVNQNELLSRNDINKIYKLAGHMGIKLPRKSSNSYSTLGRSPLIETFR